MYIATMAFHHKSTFSLKIRNCFLQRIRNDDGSRTFLANNLLAITILILIYSFMFVIVFIITVSKIFSSTSNDTMQNFRILFHKFDEYETIRISTNRTKAIGRNSECLFFFYFPTKL